MLKYIHSVALIILLIACKREKDCSFTTVKDLQEGDLKKCKSDTVFYQIKKFSGEYNSVRKGKGVPLLPEDFTVLPVTDWDNEVIWRNPAELKSIAPNSALLRQKNIQWRGDSLIKDYSSFDCNDSLKSRVSITYLLDTISEIKNYRFMYAFENIKFSTATITKAQADSILTGWGITY